MHKLRLGTGARILAMTTLVALLLGGCAQTKQLMSNLRKSPSSSGDGGILGAPGADQYLQEMYELAAGDPATQAEIYADARAGSTLTPGPSTHLRYALVLATPGHPESDPESAQSLLRELL
ncbi:MAG: hypothetical protein GWP02_05435, partial [Desulfobulbaceae bacterium]|nr:hypothetical protein [Desulfobulbaceae bacterium]